MARRVKRPSTGGESKTGLIIALVFFVLLSIGLGVATYLGFSDQEKLRGEARAAEKKARTETSHAQALEFENKILRLAHGNARLEKKDDKELNDLDKYKAMRRDFDQNKIADPNSDKPLREEIAKLLDDLNWKDPGKDPTKDDSLLQQIAALKKQLDTSREDVENQRKLVRATKDDGDRRVNEVDVKLNAALEAQKKAQDDAKKEKDVNLEHVARLEKRNKDITDENEGMKKKVDDANKVAEDKDKTIAKLQNDLKLEIERRKILDAKQVKLNPLDYQEPWGKIIRLERAGGMAYINLGSADRVKPQLTFSIAAKGADGKAAPGQRKGSLEVVRVIDRNLSLARITNVRDPFNEPVMTGDLLFNPAWSPNQRQHVAIAGIIDLKGDGTDSTAEFIRHLEQEGVVVDVYLDLRDGTFKRWGPKGYSPDPKLEGFTADTRYLIVGDKPGFESSGTVVRDDPRTERKQNVVTKMAEITDKAKDQGTSLIGYRDFLLLIGYKLPRGSSLASESSDKPPEPTLPPQHKGVEKEPGKEPDKAPGKGDAKEPKKEAPKDDKPPKEAKDK
jgi:hypothetical protein